MRLGAEARCPQAFADDMRFSVQQCVSPVRLMHTKQIEAEEVLRQSNQSLRDKLAEAERRADEVCPPLLFAP